jgi:signal transduction histidine kinase
VLARSADEALLALLNEDFAAIVLDVMLPGMSGFDLAAMIKRRQRTQQVPILFLTARMLDAQDELRGYAAGAVDYLTKPIDPQILRAKISVFVDLHRKRRALAQINVELQRQIAERQRMGEALRAANKDLEGRVSERTAALGESNRRKDDFLATLAHELRTPLSALRSATEALRMKAPEGSDLQALQGVFHRQIQQLTRFTDDLLDVSRITRDKLTLQRTRLALSQVVEAAVETARPLIQQRTHTLTLDIPPTPILLEGDPARLAQVLANLLDNAARYSEPGGRIRLSAELAGEYVLVKVEDTGSGIDREMLPRVFDLFVQGHKPPNPGEGGLGIGLPLARRLAEMHGGTVTGYSAGPGRGAEFVVRLPVLPRGTRGADTASTGEDKTVMPRGRRVLIVEDNPDTAAMLNLLLVDWGQETRVAHDGPTALEIAEKFRPEVVLLDVGLPKLHGYEVARRVRQAPWGKRALIIAITGWGREADRQSEAAGIDHRLLKPIDPVVLRGLLAGK